MFCKSYYAGIRLMSYSELFKDFLIFISVSIHYEIAQYILILDGIHLNREINLIFKAIVVISSGV